MDQDPEGTRWQKPASYEYGERNELRSLCNILNLNIHQVMKGLSFLFNDAESSSDCTESYYTMISQCNVFERKRKAQL
jgi:hypothetical protein